MKVTLTTTLDAPIDRVWDALQTPALLQHVAAPLIRFTPLDGPFEDRFKDGRKRVAMWFFGILPLGRQWIDVSRPVLGDGKRRIRDNGAGDLVRRWDHWIAIEDVGGKTRYTDEVEIEAGVLTPFIWGFAAVFYRWRQHRWRRFVRRGFVH
jgi:ligand-binding SRPBCC domain-containing protein